MSYSTIKIFGQNAVLDESQIYCKKNGIAINECNDKEKKIFNLFDKNHDGVLSSEEQNNIFSVIQNYAENDGLLSESEIWGIMFDADGKNGVSSNDIDAAASLFGKIVNNSAITGSSKVTKNLYKSQCSEQEKKYFDLLDFGGNGNVGVLSPLEQNNAFALIAKYVSDDGILTDNGALALLSSINEKNDVTYNDVKALKSFVEKMMKNAGITKIQTKVQSYCETKDLKQVVGPAKYGYGITFNLNGADSSVSMREDQKTEGLYWIQSTSLFGDKTEILNRKAKQVGKEKEMALQNGDELVVGNQVWIFNNGKLENTNLDAKTYKKLFPKGIEQEGAKLSQGGIGDCYLIATLNAMSKNPAAKIQLARMLSAPNGPDGDMYIRFPGKEGNPIVLTKKDISSLNGTSDKSLVKGSLGFKIFEDAYGQLKLNNENDKPVSMSPKDNVNEVIGNGGNSRTVLSIFLNTPAESYSFDGNEEKVLELLEQKASNPDKYIITLGSLSKDGMTDSNKYKAGKSNVKLAYQHAYTVSRVDAKNKKVYIINPWDTSKEICLSYSDFMQAFRQMYYTQVK